jgi:hypothetical protein
MTKGQKQADLERRLSNIETATRFFQVLMQQLTNSVPAMGGDLKELGMQQRDIQYRLLALQEILSVDVDIINKKAEILQVKDFQEASDKEDVEKQYAIADVVSESSVVIFTSTVEGKKTGVLRSKLLVSEIAFPDMKEKLIGKKVGQLFSTEINGDVHHITVLGIRTPPTPVATEQQPA